MDGSQPTGEPRQPAPARAGLQALLGRNLRAFGAAQIAGKVAGFLAMVALARYLGRVDFGRYTVAVALVALLQVLTEFGTSRYLVREGAQQPDALGRILGHVLQIRLGAGAATVALAAPIGVALGFDERTLVAVLLFAAASALRMVAGSFLLALQALERLGDMAAVQAQHSALQAAAMAATAAVGGGVVGVSWAVVATSALLVPWARWRLRRRWRGRVALGRRGLARTFRAAAPFAASAALFTTLTYLDSVMVNAFRGNAETGLYGAAYRILLALTFVPTVYAEAIVRSVAHLAVTDRAGMARVHSRAVAHLTMASLPVAVGGILLAGPLLRFVYGAPYADADTALALLLAGLLVVFPSWVSVTTAYAVRLERAVVSAQALAVVVNAGVNLAVIPRWGIEGAAATTLGTEALFLLVLSGLLRRAGVRSAARVALPKPAVATALMAAVVLPLRGLPLAAPVAAGAVVYAAALLLLRPFTPDDRQLLRALAARGRASGDGGRPLPQA